VIRWLVAIAFGCLVGCTAGASPTLPVPPPSALSSAPDAEGLVTVTGDAAEPGALVFGYNERLESGVIETAEDDGTFELRLRADAGDSITVWQMVGSSTSGLLELIVPAM